MKKLLYVMEFVLILVVAHIYDLCGGAAQSGIVVDEKSKTERNVKNITRDISTDINQDFDLI